MYDVYCVAGSVSYKVLSEVSYKEALQFCTDNNWEFDYNGGLVWDLVIEEIQTGADHSAPS